MDAEAPPEARTVSPAGATLLVAATLSIATLGTLVFGVINRARLTRNFRRAATQGIAPNRALLIRPCAGDEPGLKNRLLSVCEAHCDFPLRIVLAVDDPNDAALPAIYAARDALVARAWDVSIVFAPVIGPNRKASIISECLRLERKNIDTAVIADSNIDLAGFDLNRLTAGLLGDPGIGAVWAPFRETAKRRSFGNFASEAVLHFSWHSFGLLSAVDAGGLVGKLFAVRKEALAEVSDFSDLTHVLGEDAALSKALRTAGYGVRVAPLTVLSPVPSKRWSETLDRHVRWMMVVKSQRPALLSAYPLLFFNALFIYFAALLVAPIHPIPALTLAAFTFVVRVAVGAVAARMLGLRPRWPQLFSAVFIGDALLTLAFFKTLYSRSFTWRGRPLFIDRSGTLSQR